MNADFKVDIVRLMQHPIMKKPLGDLSESELCCAHDILRRLIDSSGDESFTLVDVLQISRLYYAWGELSYVMGEDPEKTIRHFLRKRVSDVYSLVLSFFSLLFLSFLFARTHTHA